MKKLVLLILLLILSSNIKIYSGGVFIKNKSGINARILQKDDNSQNQIHARKFLAGEKIQISIGEFIINFGDNKNLHFNARKNGNYDFDFDESKSIGTLIHELEWSCFCPRLGINYCVVIQD
ncbi:MAG: hypothetical protein SZ59_C0005G0042 [candidate division TM6 bacterium GW2011_GWF2_28_16]|nr:MAG: hypothetical protein SZ59_C0005G0042 [candidate division TM6 bacterium GW2011_GWF2_28_16]